MWSSNPGHSIPFHYQVSRFCFGVLISVLGVLNVLPQGVRFLNKGPSVKQAAAVQTRITYEDCFLRKMFCISGQDNHSNRHQRKEFEFLWFNYLSLVISKWQIFCYDKQAVGSV